MFTLRQRNDYMMPGHRVVKVDPSPLRCYDFPTIHPCVVFFRPFLAIMKANQSLEFPVL